LLFAGSDKLVANNMMIGLELGGNLYGVPVFPYVASDSFRTENQGVVNLISIVLVLFLIEQFKSARYKVINRSIWKKYKGIITLGILAGILESFSPFIVYSLSAPTSALDMTFFIAGYTTDFVVFGSTSFYFYVVCGSDS
jgi:hypothetical protein